MIFSSQIFMFLFLPVTILGYYLFRQTTWLKNLWLFLMSVFFYAYGEPVFIYVLLLMSLFNWGMSVFISKTNGKCQKAVLAIAIILDTSVLIIFKYLGFLIDNYNHLSGSQVTNPNIALPIGISFFTFQAISYVIDIYRNDAEVAKTPLDVGLYLLFFPQLIAGPIIRYKSIADQIRTRSESIENIANGIERFILGVGKKVLISNILGETADTIFSNTLDSSVLLFWIGAICFTLQIYFDFSGYSDMAIGLGKMFGFHFMENFNYPYISKSITEFWRRWHISLSTWFRDYIYIPLGGNRVSHKRLLINLLVVWLLTGVWHGANWTFIFWGFYYYLFLVLEKTLHIEEKKIPNIIRHLGTMFIVMIGWVIFKSASMTDAVHYLMGMAGLRGNVFINDTAVLYLKENTVILILAAVLCTPILKKIRLYAYRWHFPKTGIAIIKILFLSAILLFSISFLVKGSYNPFIYFNF